MNPTIRDYVERMQEHKMPDKQIECLFPNGKSYVFNRGVITNDYYLANQIFERDFKKYNEYVVRYTNSKSKMELIYQSGERMIWIKANENSRGHKFHGAYIDENIDLEVFKMVMVPMFVMYEGSQVKILQDELEDK